MNFEAQHSVNSEIDLPKNIWIQDTTQAMRKPGGRDMPDYKEILGLNENELEGLVVLDLGSGSKEKLSQELKDAGVNCKVISINPDMALKKYRKIITNQEKWQRNTISALAQALPLKSASVDKIFALDSVTYYIDPEEYPEDAERWAKEISRILKPGGEAKLGDIPGAKGPRKQQAYAKIIQLFKNLGLESKIEEFKIREKYPTPRYRLVITKPLKQ